MKKVSGVILAGAVAFFGIGCNNVNPISAGKDVPDLPPATSMSIPSFTSDQGLAKSATPESSTAFGLAYLTVSYWTAGVQLALLEPFTLFKICHTARPTPLSDNSGWVWSVSDDKGFSADLTGRVENHKVQWSMSVSGGTLSNFVWFTGTSTITGWDGSWTFYDTANGGTPSIAFSYQVTDVKSSVRITVVDQRSAGIGSYLEWVEQGMAMSFEAFGSEKNEKFLISWDKESEAGSIMNFITNDQYCWDTKENGHKDIACQ